MTHKDAEFWQSERFADVEVVLVTHQPAEQQPLQENEKPKILARFPGHRLRLKDCPYFSAQMERWQRKRGRQDSDSDVEDPVGPNSSRVSLSLNTSNTTPERPVSAQLMVTSTTSTQFSDKPKLVVTLQHEDEVQAAMAVLGSLYNIKPLTELLSELTQVEQLQAAVLADIWGLSKVSKEAVRLLVATADTGTGLTYELVMYYSQMSAVPSCLVPLLPKVLAVCLDSSTEHALADYRSAAEQALLTVLGDFNIVWTDPGLRRVLLGLPLDMVQLLVSSSRLKVDSEATVLYITQYYVDKLQRASKAAAIQVLGPLMRCQFLSTNWLASIAETAGTAGVSGKFVLEQFAKPALQLLKLRSVTKSNIIKKRTMTSMAAWPDSWFFEPRQYTPQDRVRLTYQLDIGMLREAAVKNANNKTFTYLRSQASGPIQGVTWQFKVKVDGTNSTGTKIGVCVLPSTDAAGFYTRPAYSISWHCTAHVGHQRLLDVAIAQTPSLEWPLGWGSLDPWGLGYMADGWN